MSNNKNIYDFNIVANYVPILLKSLTSAPNA